MFMRFHLKIKKSFLSSLHFLPFWRRICRSDVFSRIRCASMLQSVSVWRFEGVRWHSPLIRKSRFAGKSDRWVTGVEPFMQQKETVSTLGKVWSRNNFSNEVRFVFTLKSIWESFFFFPFQNGFEMLLPWGLLPSSWDRCTKAIIIKNMCKEISISKINFINETKTELNWIKLKKIKEI